MGYIPHPSVPLGHLRVYDIMLLLAMGAMWELGVRTFLWMQTSKSASLKQREYALNALHRKVVLFRNKGPSAFVETSKLERQLLAEQKALADLAEQRQATIVRCKKTTRNMDIAVCVVLFVLWYGIPMVEFSAHRVEAAPGDVLTEEEASDLAVTTFKAFLFPLSYIGMGMKVSKWGLANPQSSRGGLLLFWSAHTTVGKLMDGIEALYT
jgi:hypothetical protein